LKALNASIRSLRLTLSPILMFFSMLMSQVCQPGPQRSLYAEAPNVPFGGMENAAGLNHSVRVLAG
jgi:hypothetical protein